MYVFNCTVNINIKEEQTFEEKSNSFFQFLFLYNYAKVRLSTCHDYRKIIKVLLYYVYQ